MGRPHPDTVPLLSLFTVTLMGRPHPDTVPLLSLFTPCRTWSKDMHILGTIWKEILWSLWKCERNVGEHNTIDLVNHNTEETTTVLLFCFCTIVFEKAAVYLQSFRLIQWTIALLFKMLYRDCPNVPNWFINNFSCSKLCSLLKQYHGIISL